MLLPVAFVLGALIGWRRAAARGGDRLDRLQYAAAHGILLTLVALVGLILAGRLGLL
jgi:phosphate/sulfate permease